MTSLRRTLERLEADRDRIVLQEVLRGAITPVPAGALADRMAAARGFLRALGLAQGDRCVLLAQNSANWIALSSNDEPVIEHIHFTGTGTRMLMPNARNAITALFKRSF